MNCLIMYVTYSGNTEEIAEYIENYLCERKRNVTTVDVTGRLSFDVGTYDLIFLGTFTWDYGAVPDELEDFLANVSLPRGRVAVFGSGDTQFGGLPLYCKAVDTLVERFDSEWQGLKIEQSPRGAQEKMITQWLERVLEYAGVVNESKNVRATIS